MSDDGERWLNAIGIVLALFVLAGLGLVALGVASSPPERADDAPDADWTVERVNATHVRVVHAGGEAIPAEEMEVTVEGYRRAVAWSGLLREGDGGTFEASRGKVVRLYWLGGQGLRERMDTWQLSPEPGDDGSDAAVGPVPPAGADG